MKQRIINILSTILQFIDKVFCMGYLKRPKVIIYMDGGICSQMMMYIQGQYYAEYGLDVYYDTYWYEVNGKDQNGKMPRIFELTEMWPNLEFKTLSKFQRKWYLIFFKAKRINGDILPSPKAIVHSVYFYEYWDLPDGEYNRLYTKVLNLSTASNPESVKLDTNFKDVVGIHVRRGDLAKGDNPYYGGVTDGYFLRAIEFCNEKFHPSKYLFFSDDPDWVDAHICSHLNTPYEIMRGNKAWEDLWLLAQCPVIVASQGSFGKVASRLKPDAILIQCDNKHAIRDREKTYYIE